MPMACKLSTISLVTAKNCRSIPTSRSTIGTTGRNVALVRKNSFFPGTFPTDIATMPAPLAPLTPGRSRRSARNSASSASSCSACSAVSGMGSSTGSAGGTISGLDLLAILASFRKGSTLPMPPGYTKGSERAANATASRALAPSVKRHAVVVVGLAWYRDFPLRLRGLVLVVLRRIRGRRGLACRLAVGLGGLRRRDVQRRRQNLEHCRRTLGPAFDVELHRKARSAAVFRVFA